MSADISGHQEAYSDLCSRFSTVLEIMTGAEREESEEKLDNLVTRWIGLQVCGCGLRRGGGVKE